MSYMKKGSYDKSSNKDSRGSEEAAIAAEAISAANALGDFNEPENGGGEQGATGKNHWEGPSTKSGAEPGADTLGKGSGKGY